MNRLTVLETIKPASGLEKKQARKYARISKNPFLSWPDKTVDDFFGMLNKLPSPLKEETFVKFCLISNGDDSLLH